MTPKTHRSKKGPKLYPLKEGNEGRFKQIAKLKKEYDKQQLADREIEDYEKRNGRHRNTRKPDGE